MIYQKTLSAQNLFRLIPGLGRKGRSSQTIRKLSRSGTVAEVGWGSDKVDANIGELYAQNKTQQDAKVQAVLPKLLPLISALSEEAKVLDLCCGDGETTAQLPLSFCKRVVGCDVSSMMIDHANATHGSPGFRNNLSFVVGDATELPFKSEFDLVSSFNALHWVPLTKHPDVLAGIKRSLKPNGRIFLEFEAEESMGALIEMYNEVARTWGLGIDVSNDMSRPSPDFYRQLLQQQGFQVIDDDTLGNRELVEVVQHTSYHDGEKGLLSRLMGAWIQFPSLKAALPELKDREEFAQALAYEYTRTYPPNKDGEVTLENSLLVVTAEACEE